MCYLETVSRNFTTSLTNILSKGGILERLKSQSTTKIDLRTAAGKFNVKTI